jgi:glutaredoxin
MAKFTVWAITECPYCDLARDLLLEKRLPHEIIITDKKKDLLTEVQQKFNWKTVPVITEEQNGVEIFIGGYTDLVEYLERKTL